MAIINKQTNEYCKVNSLSHDNISLLVWENKTRRNEYKDNETQWNSPSPVTIYVKDLFKKLATEPVDTNKTVGENLITSLYKYIKEVDGYGSEKFNDDI